MKTVFRCEHVRFDTDVVSATDRYTVRGTIETPEGASEPFTFTTADRSLLKPFLVPGTIEVRHAKGGSDG